MQAPFRTSPPTLNEASLLPRERIDALLNARFERRVTVLVAGAGFGKTTVMARAFARNREAPRGIDVWVSCREQDAHGMGFAAALGEALQLPGLPSDPVPSLCDAIWSHCPTPLCVAIDDAHHLTPDSEGAALLDALAQQLPENAHLVIASRTPLELALARHVAAGHTRILREADLKFDADEHRAYESRFQCRISYEATGGWPALTALSRTTQGVTIERYLREEVLGDRGPEWSQGLARMAPLQWIDDDRARAFTGGAVRCEDLLATLPLTTADASGAVRLHALWNVALARVDPRWTDDEFSRALSCLVERKDYVEAIEFARYFERDDALVRILSTLTSVDTMDWQRLGKGEIESIDLGLPDAVQATAVGQLLHGQRRLLTDPERAVPYLKQAVELYVADADEEGELAALMALAFASIWALDFATLQDIAKRTEEQGSAPARALSLATLASLAMMQGESARTVELLDQARRHFTAMGGNDVVMLANALLDIGQPERALEEIAAGRSHANLFSESGMTEAEYEARWLAGRMSARDLEPFDHALPEVARTTIHAETFFRGVLAFQNASLGRIEAATTQLELAETLAERMPFARPVVVTARVAWWVAKGDEDEARRVLEAEVASGQADFASSPNRHSLRGAAIASVISPEARERIREWQVGPCFALALEAAEALVAWRERHDPAPAAGLAWHQHERFAVGLVPRLVLELALVAAATGNELALEVATRIAPFERRVLEEQLQSPQADVAALARRIRATTPARPPGDTQVCVLGSLELRRNGERVQAPELRRERVRALLQYLVHRRRVRRDALADELWPEFDEASASNNLRVTLSHLDRLLEPERDGSAPGFFLRRDGEFIELHAKDGLEIDIDRFDRLVAEADLADAAGDTRRCLSLHREAVALYRGDFLAESAEAPWGESERARVRAQLVRSALRAGHLHHGHAEFDEAESLCERILAIDDLSEPAYRLQAQCFLGRGDRGAARDAMARAKRVIEDAQLELEPESVRLLETLGLSG